MAKAKQTPDISSMLDELQQNGEVTVSAETYESARETADAIIEANADAFMSLATLYEGTFKIKLKLKKEE